MSRRDFIKITAALGGVLLGGGISSMLANAQPTIVHEARLLMGTIINLAVIAADQKQGQDAITATYAAMQTLTQFFDYRRPDTALGRLNRVGELEQPPTELVGLLKQAVQHGELSGGAFDVSVLPVLAAYRANRQPTVQEMRLVDYHNILIQEDQLRLRNPGMAITLDGIAKGRVVDGGVSKLKELGYTNIMVEAGGDLLANGKNQQGEPWKIGVMNPRQVTGKQWLASFGVTDRAVATSGDYQNAFSGDFSLNHIIDPQTGSSPSELASVTTIAATVMEADAFSTTLMVLGIEKGLSLVERLPGVEALLVTKDLQIFRSSGFPSE
jgi:FAD:protein FMN transferase